ncbi:glycosyltransferase [Butyrivibrio sp. DSM 10294]|uniref:glycosyltransferase family protein n=1 Tax=Butyrivibrio sp. DSM 10294 TaxID=2972457 RepID=UPI00234E4072|nr:glycosyltransferase [Butyrivibrio sp. DSM 10294]MDC7293604.1 glycosyltransferase [Butyrivibrio sp. DSM 10294]
MSDINIIVFKGMLKTVDYFIDQLIKYCHSNSINIYVADANIQESYNSEAFHNFSNRPNTVMYTINNVGIRLESNDGINYWKRHNIPVFDHLVDHPRNYDDALLKPFCDTYALCLDLEHIQFIKEYYPLVKDTFFFPNGGTEVDNSIPFEERPIDVLYMGSCQENIPSFPSIKLFEDNGASFYSSTISLLLKNTNLSTAEAISLYLDSTNISPSKDILLELNLNYAGLIESIARRLTKLSGMKALDDMRIKVEIFGGNSWIDEAYPFSDNITIHDRISPEELMPYIGKAKISLCFIPWYKQGCSEKNFDSMLNGALCVTDRSSYLEMNYRDGENIIYFDLSNPAQMAADVKWLLEHPSAASIIAQRGYETAKAHDSWDVRFAELISTMRDVIHT